MPTQDTRDSIRAIIKVLDTVFIPVHGYHGVDVILNDFRRGRVS